MFRRLASLLLLSLTALCAGPALALPSAVVTTEQVRAELVAHAPEGLAPGKTIWLGLLIEHKPHWHTYWKNPGDSGLPTTLQWTLPAGVTAGEIDWPTPKRLPIGPLVNYGFEGRTLLPVPVTLPADFARETLPVQLRADWLVCKDVCIPESGEFALAIPARSAFAAHGADFDAAFAARPQPAAGATLSAEVTADGALKLAAQGLPAAWQGQALQFFPETAGVIENAAATGARWDGAQWRASIPLSAQRSESPAAMAAVLTTAGQPAGLRVEFKVAGAWPAPGVSAAPAESPAAAGGEAGAAASTAPFGLATALAFALVGGLILNLMPCVFPVLSLKVFGFAAHAHEPRTLAAGGIAYTVGVVASFVALAAALLALRAGGEQLGWGFQLQSPGFVALLAALFTLIGLNLAGVFEFGSVLPSGLASLRAKHPLVDSFLTGVLAVAVASPCTAPFMGASLGLAVTLPAVQALAVFGALGLGMALPYLAISLAPGLARWLPRPGAWMARFRTLMAFPMFATVVWLIWVIGQQVGIDGAAALLGTLVALAFVAWALGTPGLGRGARAALGTLSVLAFAAALTWTLPALESGAAALQTTTPAAAPGTLEWQPWSTQAVADARAAGKPVFVDFTAAWCVTCQYNKRTTLAHAEVIGDFAKHGVVLLRADWTRRDPAITAELARFGRNGVPVYAVYAPGNSSAPKLLSEILSVGEVRDAIRSAASKESPT